MLDKFLATHANSLQMRSRRTQILASNIANADTPNYKARDLAFAEVMRDAGRRPGRSAGIKSSKSLSATHAKHIRSAVSPENPRVMYRQPEGASLDGNTVDKDLEQARFAENAVRYQASLEFINSRVSGLIRTLRSE